MGLITKTVTLKIVNSNIKHFLELGYQVSVGDLLTVPVEHLSSGSKVIVQVQCDVEDCNEVSSINYYTYLRNTKEIPFCVCKKHRHVKARMIYKKRTGYDNPMQNPEVKQKAEQTLLSKYGTIGIQSILEIQEKTKQTNLEHWGNENPMLNPIIRQKQIETLMKNYNVTNPMYSDEIKQRNKNTCLEKYGSEYYMNTDDFNRAKEAFWSVEENKIAVYEQCRKNMIEIYGVENPSQLPGFKEKCQETYNNKSIEEKEAINEKRRMHNILEYGVDNVMKYPEFQKRNANSLYQNQTVATSKQQLYLHKLYGGELNGIVTYYNCDIVFEQNKFILEYDGGGHSLSVTLGSMTQEEFDQRQIIRNERIKRSGYKIMRIISRHDKLPSDEILLAMLSAARTYFTTTEHTWIEYDIDNQTVRNALNKEGVFFDYGELRTIKQAA